MNIEDLKETAALAHLNLDEKELAAAFPAFEQMLGYFAAMQAADQEGHPPVSGSPWTVASDHFRRDKADTNHINDNSSGGLSEDLLDRAGERDGRFVVVPNVL
jgi:aspartyl-tRNA(Asn)/glutamyl-tRNA(Gln) amidotransferase subunit C